MQTPEPFETKDTAEPVSETLDRMSDYYSKSEMVTVKSLLKSLKHRGFALLMLAMVLPNCVPVPIPPGGSTLFSIPLFFISIQMLMGRNSPWLPKWLINKSIKQSTVAKTIKLATPRLRWVEKFLHPRFNFTSTKAGERAVGFIWLVFAISIAVPLPMTNFIPGVGTLIMALGMLSRDGVVVVVGAIIGMAGVAFTTAMLTLGISAAMALFPFFANSM